MIDDLQTIFNVGMTYFPILTGQQVRDVFIMYVMGDVVTLTALNEFKDAIGAEEEDIEIHFGNIIVKLPEPRLPFTIETMNNLAPLHSQNWAIRNALQQAEKQEKKEREEDCPRCPKEKKDE